MNIKKSDYNNFAKQYSETMSDEGDYFHKTQIDPYIYKIIGDVNGKTVYDLGCGNGYISRYLAKQGATVFASDISEELVNIAREKSEGLNINYSVRDATDFSDFDSKQFDIVIMNMVVQYVDNIDELFSGISSILKQNGIFAFSTDHFLKPAEPYSSWELGKKQDKDAIFSKITGYLEKDVRHPISPWDNKTELTIYKRPFGEFVNSLSKNGLYLKNLYEPQTPEFPKGYSSDLTEAHLIPTFMILSAVKI